MGVQESHDLFSGVVVELAFVHLLEQEVAADVRGHDHDGVLEVHRAALAVGQAAVVKKLQQRVEDVRVSLFYLVQEDDGVGLPSDGFRQLSALVIAYVSRRSTDQAAHGEFLHILRHIETYDVLFGVEESLRQSFCQFRFADAGRAQEDEGTDRPSRVFQAGAGSYDRVGHGFHCLVLTDDALVQRFVDLEELFLFAFHDLADRDASPAADHIRDLVLGDLLF